MRHYTKAAEPVSSGPDPALEEEKELVERELVIGHLKSRLGSYQNKSEELSAQNIELIDELETQRVNLKDINEFLTNEKKAKELATAEMEQRVEKLTVRAVCKLIDTSA